MMKVVAVWGQFVGLIVLIYIFGVRASISADIIAEKKGWARAFMGIFLISMITSFPELFTGISSVTIKQSPDFAVGEILGSCIFNLLIIAIIEIFFRKHNLYHLKGKINTLPLGFGFILINILTIAIALKLNVAVFHVGLFSIAIFMIYFIFLRFIYLEKKVEESKELYKSKNLKKEAVSFFVSSVIIIGIGVYLPIIGDRIAMLMGWKRSFVGVIFFALVTSLPELVVSFTAAKIGAFEMVLGNIAGSNLFNIAIIFFFDIFYIKGIVINQVSNNYVTIGLIALLMNFVVFFALIRRSSYRIFNFVSLNALLLIVLYILNLIISNS